VRRRALFDRRPAERSDDDELFCRPPEQGNSAPAVVRYLSAALKRLAAPSAKEAEKRRETHA
jgi:hypothetical protein